MEGGHGDEVFPLSDQKKKKPTDTLNQQLLK